MAEELSIDQRKAVAIASARARAAKAKATASAPEVEAPHNVKFTPPKSLRDMLPSPSEFGDSMVEHLPLIGGVLGGMAGAGGGSVPLAALGGAGGEAWRQVIDRGRGKGEVPASSLGAAKDIAVSAAEQGGSQKVGELAAPYLEKGAKYLMQSALKPPLKSIMNSSAAQAIDTLLREGINVTHGGAEKLQGMIDGLKGEVSNLIDNSPATIDAKAAVKQELLGTLNKMYEQGLYKGDTRAIRAAWKEFLSNPIVQDFTQMPVKLAQSIKQGTQRSVSERYGALSPDPGKAAAEKAIASGLRKELENAVPGVKDLNAKASDLINAVKLVNRRVGIEGNRNPVGVGVLSPHIEQALGWMLDRMGGAKSLAARALHSGQEEIPTNIMRLLAPYLDLKHQIRPEQPEVDQAMNATRK